MWCTAVLCGAGAARALQTIGLAKGQIAFSAAVICNCPGEIPRGEMNLPQQARNQDIVHGVNGMEGYGGIGRI